MPRMGGHANRHIQAKSKRRATISDRIQTRGDDYASQAHLIATRSPVLMPKLTWGSSEQVHSFTEERWEGCI